MRAMRVMPEVCPGHRNESPVARPDAPSCLICFWSFCLAWLTLCGVANAATLTLAWNPNAEPDIGGYVLYWGTQSGVYTSNSNVGNVTTKQVTGLADGTVYYFAVKAYNTAGLMSGYSSEVSGQTSGGAPPPPVNCTNTPTAPGCVTGTDFNGDSQPDLIWQNDSTWQVVVWYMGGSQGAVPQGWTWLSQAGVPGWRIVAARDFNGDGKPDLVWQNDNTRQVSGLVYGRDARQRSTRLELAVPGWRTRLARSSPRAISTPTGSPISSGRTTTTRQVSIWYMGGAQGNTSLGVEFVVVVRCCRLACRRHGRLQRRRQERPRMAGRRDSSGSRVAHGREPRQPAP